MRRMPEPMDRSAGDDEAADLARSPGSGCRRTARGCSPRPARCARSRRTSRRRTRRRRPRWPPAMRMYAGGDRHGPRGRRPRTSASMARRSSGVSAAVERDSRSAGSRASTSEPACARRLADACCGAPDGAGACPCGCASCGRAGSASTSARDAPGPPRRGRGAGPRWTMSPPTGRWVSSTVNRTLAGRRVPEHALVADLAAALGVEGRPVEHELGRRRRPRPAARPRAAASSSWYSSPSRTMATTRPGAIVVS